MSRPPAPPFRPPTAIAANIAWQAPSWFQDEQHNTPPPPGVSLPPSTSHKANLYPWIPAPGHTNQTPTTPSPGPGAAFYRQHAPMQATLIMNANETPHVWASAESAGAPYQHQQTVASQLPPKNGPGALNVGYGVQNSGYEPQNFAYPLACKEIASTFSSNIPSTQIPQQLAPTESSLSQKKEVWKPTNLGKVDVKDLIPNLKALVSQANEAVAKILNMVKMSPETLPVKSLNPQAVGGTEQYFTDLDVIEYCKDHQAASQSMQTSDDFSTANQIFNSILVSLRKSTKNTFYTDAPGVVQIPVLASEENEKGSKLPDFAVGERWDELTPKGFADKQRQEMLLPSRYWLISNRISDWKDLPSKLSSDELKTMASLSWIHQKDLRKWLLLHSFSYGVTFSRYIADHIVMLAVFCLRAVCREAAAHLGLYDDERQVDFRALSQSASWLAMQLSLICGASYSRNLVLDLYKHAINVAACYSTTCARNSHKALQDKESTTMDHKNAPDAALEKEPCNSPYSSSQADANHSHQSSFVGNGVLCLRQLAAAIVAIEAQAVHLSCQTSELLAPSSDQRSAVHSMLTKEAAETRATRLDYRAVLDHDGLMWQRVHTQDSKRNMTKEELLAEERDYKRRRMSYRGKKVQRTPVEVLRDIIEGHMEDIVAAGGIACISRRPQDVHFQESEILSSAVGTKDVLGDTSSSRDASSREAHSSYRDGKGHPRSESMKSFRTEKVERSRYDLGSHRARSQSLDKNSQEKSDRM